MGDFNTCLIKDDYRSKQLLSLLHSLDLNCDEMGPIHFPHNARSSFLDLIVTSFSELIDDFDDCMTWFMLHSKYVKVSMVHPVFKAENVDEVVKTLNLIILILFDKHAPLQVLWVKHLLGSRQLSENQWKSEIGSSVITNHVPLQQAL